MAFCTPIRCFALQAVSSPATSAAQSGLWGYGISGDLPIVLLRIDRPVAHRSGASDGAAHAYWRVKGLAVDLVIWNEDQSGYRQVLQEQILGIIASRSEASSAG